MRSWRGEDLEEALATAGAVGYAVRSRNQWLEHPQGRTVASLPVLQSESTTGPSRITAAGRGAVGLRVLDLTRVIAGPVATRTLAAWGAEVLRIDSPNWPEIPAQAVDTLPGKHSAELDLTEPIGRSRLEELLYAADLVVQGYRPGALARYGLDPNDLAERHPHLNIVTLSRADPGPWACRRGFDSLVQCPTGIAFAEGIDGRPGVLPAQVLDHATGYLAAAAGLLALAGVQRGEAPRSVRLSLAQTADWLFNGGDTTREPRDEPNPDDFQITLPGAERTVHVISPPVPTVRPGSTLEDSPPTWVLTRPDSPLPMSHDNAGRRLVLPFRKANGQRLAGSRLAGSAHHRQPTPLRTLVTTWQAATDLQQRDSSTLDAVCSAVGLEESST